MQLFVLDAAVCVGCSCLCWMQLFVTELCAGCSCLCWMQLFVTELCVGCSCLLLSCVLDAAVCY